MFHSTPRSRRHRNPSTPEDKQQQPFFTKAGHQAVQTKEDTAFFQPKLTIGQPGDQYEKEADSVADSVVNQPQGKGGKVQRQEISNVQRLSTPDEEKMPGTNDARMAQDKEIQEKPEVQRMEAPKEEEKPVQKMEAPKEEEKPVQKMEAPKEEEKSVQKMEAPKEEEKPVQKMEAPKEEEKPVQKMDAPKEEEKPVQKADAPEKEEEPVAQAKPANGQTAAKSAGLSSRLSQRQGKGEPLPAAARSKMEQGIGADFSGVRIHNDTESAEMNKDLHAQAFTHGQDVFFNAGKYDPESSEGQRLLAHELTHVVQQGASQELEEGAVQRNLWGDIVRGAKNVYHDVAEGVGLESHEEAEQGKLNAFLEHGLYGPQSLVPPTNTGGFDASFDPSTKELFIEVKTGVNFQNGLTLGAGNTILSQHPDLNQAAIDGNTLNAADRPAFVADFMWSRAQERDFLMNLRSRIIEAWDGRYAFECTRPGWESVTANVVVDVDTHRGAARGDDHMQSTVYKVPDNGGYQVGAFVNSGTDQNAHNNQMVLSSFHANAAPPANRNLLRKQVFFANNSAVLDAGAKGTLNGFAADFQDANLDLSNPVLLEGHASSTGSTAYNQKLAQQRIDAVRNHLASIGFTGINERVAGQNEGEAGATDAAFWRRVDLIVGNGQGQVVAAHEFGHVFGLMDEYAINPGGGITGTGNPTGTIVGHDQMAKDIGTPGAVAENNDDIMSLGRVVRPKHYATFGWALSRLTGINQWQVK